MRVIPINNPLFFMIFPMKNEYRKKIGMLDIFKINFDFSESIKLPFTKLDIRKVMMNIKAKNIAVHSKICLRFFFIVPSKKNMIFNLEIEYYSCI